MIPDVDEKAAILSLLANSVLIVVMVTGVGMMARLSTTWCLNIAVMAPVPLLIDYLLSGRPWNSWYPLFLSLIVVPLLAVAWRKSVVSPANSVQEQHRFVRGALYFALPIVLLAFMTKH